MPDLGGLVAAWATARPAFLAPVSGELLRVACEVAAVALSGCSGVVAAAATRTAESAGERLMDAVVAVAVPLLPGLLTLAGVLALLRLTDPVLAAIGLLGIPALAVLSTRQRRLVDR